MIKNIGIKSLAKRKLFSIGSWLFYFSKIYKIFLNRKSQKNNAICIFYHDIAPKPAINNTSLIISESLFWNHINKLIKDFNFISINDLLNENINLSNPLVLSFDGYSKKYLDLAKKLSANRVNAIFYIHTQPIQDNQVFWRQKVYYILEKTGSIKTNKLNLNLKKFAGATGFEVNNLSNKRKLFEIIEDSPNKNDIVDLLAKENEVDLNQFITDNPPLTPSDTKEMAELDGIEIGSHSHTHPVKDNLSADKFEIEISKSKELLENWTGISIKHYAYPSGMFNKKQFELLKKHNYHTAATTEKKLAEVKEINKTPYRLPRFGVQNYSYPHLVGDIVGLKKRINQLF